MKKKLIVFMCIIIVGVILGSMINFKSTYVLKDVKLKEITDKQGLIFELTNKTLNCVTKKLEVYNDNTYILKDVYLNQEKIEYDTPFIGEYEYNIKELLNSIKVKSDKTYTLTLGNGRKINTDSNNKKLMDFLSKINVNMDLCSNRYVEEISFKQREQKIYIIDNSEKLEKSIISDYIKKSFEINDINNYEISYAVSTTHNKNIEIYDYNLILDDFKTNIGYNVQISGKSLTITNNMDNYKEEDLIKRHEYKHIDEDKVVNKILKEYEGRNVSIANIIKYYEVKKDIHYLIINLLEESENGNLTLTRKFKI